MNNEVRAKNAIKWIENLPSYKQARKEERGYLGSNKHGYCCIGAGCEILKLAFKSDDILSNEFQHTVGLKHRNGNYTRNCNHKTFYNQFNLAAVNDNTNAGFKRIASFMKKYPELMFHDEVAPLIAKHFA